MTWGWSLKHSFRWMMEAAPHIPASFSSRGYLIIRSLCSFNPVEFILDKKDHQFFFYYIWVSVYSISRSCTVLPSRVRVTSWFVYKVIRAVEWIDHLCINPIRRIGLIHMWSIDSRFLKWSVQVNVLLNNCKQNTTSLSLLAGRIVDGANASDVEGSLNDI